MINANFCLQLSLTLTYLYKIRSVLGKVEPHAVIASGLLKEKEAALLFLKKSGEYVLGAEESQFCKEWF